ncbi:hypothetical protein Trydic_g11753 [Trypoxylus dichotomus]
MGLSAEPWGTLDFMRLAEEPVAEMRGIGPRGNVKPSLQVQPGPRCKWPVEVDYIKLQIPHLCWPSKSQSHTLLSCRQRDGTARDLFTRIAHPPPRWSARSVL